MKKKISGIVLLICLSFILPLKTKAAEKDIVAEYIPLKLFSGKAAELFTPEFTKGFLQICTDYDVDYCLMLALIEAESGFDPNAVNGTHYGLCQISSIWHEKRAAGLGVNDLYDPLGNVLTGTDYIRELLDKDLGTTYALMSYRLGEKGARKKYKQQKTISYSENIEKRMAEIKNALKTGETDMKKIKVQPEDGNTGHVNIRPASIEDYIGQTELKDNLSISITAAKMRNSSLDHFLFSGPPGLGKTSLAAVVAHEMNTNLKTVNAPILEKPKDIASILATLEDKDILFIDEIHRLPKNVEEMLYQAMEDKKIDIIIGDAEQAKVITMPLADFTLIGATTREGLLSKPLLDRFQNKYTFEYYSESELGEMAYAAAKKYDTPISIQTARLIGKISRGTPRIAVSITKRLSDYMLAKGIRKITQSDFNKIMCLMGINKNGLSVRETKYLEVLRTTYQKTGKAVGLKTIAAYMGETTDTIEDVIEPYLLRKKMVTRLSGGRIPMDTVKEE